MTRSFLASSIADLVLQLGSLGIYSHPPIVIGEDLLSMQRIVG
jgi:hypothetical protein